MLLGRFIEDCVRANGSVDPQAAVLDVLSGAVRQPAALLAALGEPREAGITVLHCSASLTIFNATWTPRMNLMPHNHGMWANIGIYTGREDNILWRPGAQRLEAFEARALFAGDVAALPCDVIHSVTNPLPKFTGGIHIYGGDFFAIRRSQWNPETLQEEPSDGATIRRIFQRENERLRPRGDRSTHMASIYRTFVVNAAPEFVWDALKDVGAVHTRLAREFVTATRLEGSVRTVTFANGFVAREQIVTVDDENRRLVYGIVGGRATHHNAFFQVFPAPGGNTSLLWVTDLLPDDVREPIEQMVDAGIVAIQRTLQSAFAAR